MPALFWVRMSLCFDKLLSFFFHTNAIHSDQDMREDRIFVSIACNQAIKGRHATIKASPVWT